MRGIRWRTVIILFFLALAGWYIYPTIKLFSLSTQERRAMDPAKLAELESRSLRLGLDLMGGMHLVLEVDKSKLTPEEAKDAVDRALEIIRNRVDQFGVAEPVIQKQGRSRIIVQLPGLQDPERAKALIGRTAQLEFKLVKEGEEVDALLNEIDVALARRMPRAKEQAPEDLDWLFAGVPPLFQHRPFTSLLRIYEDPRTGKLVSIRVAEENRPKVDRVLSDPEIRALIPPDAEFLWASETEVYQGKRYYSLYLVRKTPELTGAHIADARPEIGSGYDPEIANKPIVAFTTTDEGARIFSLVTGANIGRRLAIVLDNKVCSAPVIRTKLSKNSIITGNFTMEEARDLAIVLRAGALPAPIKIVEERTVGPSLGRDSIEKGKVAAVIGFIAVVVFMAVYYRFSGLIADLALVLNLVFLVAALAGFGATLTLPGLAGIVLIVGLAVDANVLIFERIREELRTGKTVRLAIDNGYSRAFRTILDANLTTLITALVLYKFGTGPIKGFAVTLSIGILASMFTAIVMTKAIFDFVITRWRVTRLSI